MQVTLPLPGAANDGRPKALQIETAAIRAKNCSLNQLRADTHFTTALQAMKEGWLFTSEDTKQFPHYQDDFRVLPARLQELLNQEVRVGRRRGESCSEDSSTSSTALAPEENSSEMVSFQGWYVTTSCVHVAFANSYTHKATLRTKTFIDDFPVHMWLFLPPSSPDSSLPSSPSLPSNPSSLLDPRFSIIAHVPSEVRAELERLQLLFIMRLKDSFTSFKTSLMKFLDPDTFAPHLKETLEAHRLANKDADMEPDTPTMTISGCIILNHVEASILLPTLFTAELRQQDVSCDQHSTTHTPTMTSQAATPTRISPDLEESISAGTTVQQPHPHSPAPPLRMSPAPIRANSVSCLNTEASLTPASNSPSVSLMSLTGSPSPSMVSLPVIVEAGSAGVAPISMGNFASTSNLDTRQHCTLPTRSLSAVELLPRPVLEKGDGPPPPPPQDEDCAPQSKEEEEEFVLVKYPTLSPQNVPMVDLEEAHSIADAGTTSPLLQPPLFSPSMHSPTPSEQSSTKRMKSPPPLRTMPQFVLHVQLDNILALPNIKAGEIAVKLSVGTVALRELSTTEYQGMKELHKKTTSPSPTINAVPTIKARLEVGDQVGRFYPSECAGQQDIILIAKAEGLDLSLLLPNITIMKDFFDDEYESLFPLPLHLKVATTRAVLVEDLSHSADHVQSMAVGVEQLEVHRGRELSQEADIFCSNAISR